MEYILTMDAGTTGIKCAAFSRQGEALASHVEGYPTRYPNPGWAQQEPEAQLAAALRAIAAVLAGLPPTDCAAMVCTGTMNGCIPIGRDGVALHDNIIHSDLRAAPQCARIASLIPPREYYAVTGNRIDVHSGFPKYMWLRENLPEIYQKAWKFVNIKDYLYGRFTGRAGHTDPTDASLCNCLDLRTGDWAWDIVKACGVDADKLPGLLSPCDVSAGLDRQFAALTGLPQGLPVAVGAGDGACAAHGARDQAVGDMYMNIGSSAWVSTLSPTPCRDPEMRLFSYFDSDGRGYNVCGTVQCGAAAFDWAVRNLLGMERPDYAALESMAREIAPGAQGMFYLPTLMGERTPWWTAEASGTLMGFTLYHDRRHIARAVYEGVMQALHLCGDILTDNGLPAKRLTLIGGGAKSALWGQMAADMFGVPVRIHRTPHEATSLGAALTAGVGIGWYKDFAEAARCIRVAREYDPDPAAHEAYGRHMAVFRTLYPDMKNAYRTVYRYQQENEGDYNG